VKQLGIIAALPAEAKTLAARTDKLHDLPSPQQLSDQVLLVISGIGAEQAAKAASTLIQDGASALLSWGCAGALSDDLQPGDVLLPNSVTAESGKTLHTDKQWHARLSELLAGSCTPVTGALVNTANIITEVAQKQALYQSGGAVAVDMESAAIAQVAQDAHIPFMAIRAIADDAKTFIPAYINKAMDAEGHIMPFQMAGLLLMHPASWRQLMRLGRQFNAATSTLSHIVERLGVDKLLLPRRPD